MWVETEVVGTLEAILSNSCKEESKIKYIISKVLKKTIWNIRLKTTRLEVYVFMKFTIQTGKAERCHKVATIYSFVLQQ